MEPSTARSDATSLSVLALLIVTISVARTDLHSTPANSQRAPTVHARAEEEKTMGTVPPIQHVDKATAQQELQSYIFGGRYGRKMVPTKLNPAHVEEFIRQRLDRAKPADAFANSRRVVDYYDLLSVLDHFEKMLTSSEKDSRDFARSVQCLKILSDVGTAAHNRKADGYFQYLVKHALAPESYDLLVEAVEVMDTDADAKLLSDRMEASQKALAPKTSSDREADDEYQRIEQWLKSDLPRAVGDAKLRHQILTLPAAEERIGQLSRTYLGWGENDTIELTWWSARSLRHEAKAGRPDLVMTMLRKTADEIEASDLPKEEKEPYLVRAARAVKFLDGALTPKERRILQRASSSQVDVLDREP